MIDNLGILFLIFIDYSFLGWLLEVISKSYSYKKLVNRGFLFGPICPIYGFGGILISLLLTKYKNDIVVVFILGAVLTSTIEYLTSYILEKVFHNKWWDYSNRKFNINGRVRLDFSVLFGFFSLLVIYVLNDWFLNIINMLEPKVIDVVAIILFIILIIDTIYSIIIAYNLRSRIIIAEELKKDKLTAIPGYIEKVIKESSIKFKLFPTRLIESVPLIKSKNEEIFNRMIKLRDKLKKKNKN